MGTGRYSLSLPLTLGVTMRHVILANVVLSAMARHHDQNASLRAWLEQVATMDAWTVYYRLAEGPDHPIVNEIYRACMV